MLAWAITFLVLGEALGGGILRIRGQLEMVPFYENTFPQGLY